jgi:Transposase.
MKKQDARKLDHKGLTQLRQRAIHAIQNGESPEIVARVLGVSRAAIYNWLAKYRQGGWGQLDARKRGGRPPKLDGPSFAFYL